jgi:hypothetical protein
MSGDDALTKFGSTGGSNVTPASIIVLVLACVLVAISSRKTAAVVFLFAALLLPFRTALVVAGIHFQLIRFLLIPALIRIFMQSNAERPIFGKWHPIDKAFIAFQAISAVAFIALNPEMGAVINQIGSQYTAIGAYLVLRYFIKDEEDVLRSIKVLITIGVIAALGMVAEHATGGRNFFAVLGSLSPYDGIREGRLRAQAFFSISIIAGCYGASLLPLSAWLWTKSTQLRKWALLGFVASTVVTMGSASSTPLMGYLAGIGAYAFWPFRNQMKWVRRGIVLMLISLHLVMKAPVWQLIARVDLVGGNSADHRYQLINQCIIHFRDWWLIGTNDNYKWGWDMWDTANYYVATAEGTGLLSLILLLAIISRSFRSVGLARAAFPEDKRRQWMFWSIGAVLFSHCVSFIGISYFDQAFVAWFALLAIVIALTLPYSMPKAQPVESTMLTRRLAGQTPVPAASGRAVEEQRRPEGAANRLYSRLR